MEKNETKPTGLFQSVASKLSRFFKRENPTSEPLPDLPKEQIAERLVAPEKTVVPEVVQVPVADEVPTKKTEAPEPTETAPEETAVAPETMPTENETPQPVAEKKQASRKSASVPLPPTQAPLPDSAEDRPAIYLASLQSKRRLHISDLSQEEAELLLSSFVKEHISDEQLSVETMAQQLKVSRTGLYQLVHDIFGVTPANYIMDIRLKYSTDLLMKGKKVREVSAKCGFSDPKYFSKVFKKYYGVLPSNYCAAE